jgi:hypothetical protein
MTPFQEQEDDEDFPDNVPNYGPAEPSQTPSTTIKGPITRSCANKLQQEVYTYGSYCWAKGDELHRG